MTARGRRHAAEDRHRRVVRHRHDHIEASRQRVAHQRQGDVEAGDLGTARMHVEALVRLEPTVAKHAQRLARIDELIAKRATP